MPPSLPRLTPAQAKQQFAEVVLDLLEDPDWSPDTLDQIANAAQDIGLVESGPQGTIRRTAEARAA